MAGLGLTDALGSLQQGLAWRDAQQEKARAMQQRAILDKANAAASDIIKAAETEEVARQRKGWLDAGNDPLAFKPQPYKVSGKNVLAALDARGAALAAGGDMNGFIQNEVIATQARQKARGEAWQAFQVHKDPGRLMQEFYEAQPDGKSITSFELVKGGSPGLAGAPSGPDRYRFKLSDGTTQMATADEILKSIPDLLADPEALAKRDFQLSYLTKKGKIDQEREAAKIEAQGKKERETKRFEHELGMNLEGVKFNNQLGLAILNNEASQKRAETSAAATRYSADRGAQSREYAVDNRPKASDATIKVLREERIASKDLLTTLNNRLKTTFKSAERAALQKQILEATDDYMKVGRKIAALTGEEPASGGPGLKDAEPASGATPKPTAAAPKASGLPDGVPAGSKQIGTSGGKPVYQAPNGKKYIAD